MQRFVPAKLIAFTHDIHIDVVLHVHRPFRNNNIPGSVSDVHISTLIFYVFVAVAKRQLINRNKGLLIHTLAECTNMSNTVVFHSERLTFNCHGESTLRQIVSFGFTYYFSPRQISNLKCFRNMSYTSFRVFLGITEICMHPNIGCNCRYLFGNEESLN